MTRLHGTVLLVDSDPVLLETWAKALGETYKILSYSDAHAALRALATHEIDVAVVDLALGEMDGISFISELTAEQPLAQSILVSGHGTVETAVSAIKRGAFDFVTKGETGVDLVDSLKERIERALAHKRLKELGDTVANGDNSKLEIIGSTRGVRRLRALIEQIADSLAPVLICGESGTGKELVAKALHRGSARQSGPFVAVNCAALTETLIDSELFGHERGAFTGATGPHKGVFEAAHGGVLFLDEIGDVPQQTQVRLLRAIQEREVRPVGANAARAVDVRVVAATNVDLGKAMRAGSFREDLYYRISTFRLEVPSLRERASDIPLIAQHLLLQYVRRSGLRPKKLSPKALEALSGYDWPGNVRELANAIEHAATLSREEEISEHDLPSFVRPHLKVPASQTALAPYREARAQLLESFERRYLNDLLSASLGNLSEASRRSGIDRSNLRRLLRRYQMKVEVFRQTNADAIREDVGQ